MNVDENTLRLALTGALPLALLVASVLAVPLSWLALRRYRAAVLRGMSTSAGTADSAAVAVPDRSALPGATPPAHELSFEEVPAASVAPTRAGAGPWRAAARYAAAGGVYAAMMAVGMVIADPQIDGSAGQLAALTLGYLWPTVMVVMFVAAYDRRRRLQLLGAYAAAWVLLAAVLALGPTGGGAFALLATPFFLNVVPTLLVLGFSLRPIRAVGLLVLSALFVVALGAQSVLQVAAVSEGFLRAVAALGDGLGLGAKAVVGAMLAAGIAAGAALVLPMARAVARRYQARRFSDQSLVVDAHFLVFGVVQSLGPAAGSPRWFGIGLVAFAAYKAAAWLALRGLAASTAKVAATPPARSLLLLRVFKLGARSERLFDCLRRHWLHEGPVRMIAGPDLVTTTVEPHEFLDFVGGRLDRRFVQDDADRERRLAQMRHGTDPDGRHRIEAFFCRADTWRGTMQRLAQEGDAVLMDLRTFAPGNEGCLYEIGQLLDLVDLRRVLFVVDGATQPAFVEKTLREAWRQLDARSPNRAAARPTVRWMRIDEPTEPALRGLCAALAARPAPQAADLR